MHPHNASVPLSASQMDDSCRALKTNFTAILLKACMNGTNYTHTMPIKAALETLMGRQHVSSAPLSENTSSNTTRLTHAERQRCAEDPKNEDVKMNPLLPKP